MRALRASDAGRFPDGVTAPVQYGPRITAIVVYLLHYQLLPENRLAEAMADLFGVKLVAATIARMSRTCAERAQGFADAVCALVKAATVKHMDETGFRIGGKTQWLHVACTLWLVFYRVSPKRGSLLEGSPASSFTITGSPITPWRACCMPCATPTTCANSRPWSRSRKRTGRAGCSACCAAPAMPRSGPRPGRAAEARLVDLIRRRYDAIVAEGLAFHEAQPPLARATTKGGKRRGAVRRAGPATTCCCAWRPARATCCAS